MQQQSRQQQMRLPSAAGCSRHAHADRACSAADSGTAARPLTLNARTASLYLRLLASLDAARRCTTSSCCVSSASCCVARLGCCCSWHSALHTERHCLRSRCLHQQGASRPSWPATYRDCRRAHLQPAAAGRCAPAAAASPAARGQHPPAVRPSLPPAHAAASARAPDGPAPPGWQPALQQPQQQQRQMSTWFRCCCCI